MSDWQVQLEFEEGTSSKFWRARVDGKTLYVNYGRIGANGQTQVKEFPSADGAQKEFDKLVREKRKKGYADAGGGDGGGGDEDADDDDDEDEDEDEDGADDEDAAPPKKKSGLAALAAAAAADDDDEGELYTLTAGKKTIEARVILDGKTVRMNTVEHYESAEAAKKALERLKKNLAAEGYKPG
jgi:predicted DNA-binding WGR domain protein